MIRIDTPKNIYARFFMRNDSVDEIDVMPSQVHGNNIIHVRDNNLPERPEADGILLTTTKVSAAIRVADCAPVMLCGEGWVMILHSGFKGTVLNITAKGIEMIRELYGNDEVKRAYAWIGPCIGREDYERDSNEEWSIRGMNVFHRENFDLKGEKVYFDLAGEIESQLLECGITNIEMTGINTYRSPDCYSYRNGDIKERMTLYAKIESLPV